MKLASKWMALTAVTVAVTMTVLTLAQYHGDHECMLCPCAAGQCSGVSAPCCYRFYTFALTSLSVSVNCSLPEQSHIIDPVASPSVHVYSSFNCSGFRILHENSCLTAFPDNYCKYGATRAVIMDHNQLSLFPELQCLSNLGILDLRHNNLTSVPQDAFKGLKYIREIHLDNNEISYIHPLAFGEDMTELSIFSVSHNQLVTVEACFLALPYSFCYFDFSHNHLHHFTNRANWKVNTSKDAIYGPGFVNFSYNEFEDGPAEEIAQFGISGILQLTKFVRWGFDFRHNPFRCDCKLYEVIKVVKALAFLQRDYFNVTCGSPPSLHGFPMLGVSLEQLVCNVTRDCPPGCYCEDQPAKEAIVIFCGNGGLTSLPDALPEGDHLIVHMANNSFPKLASRQYLNRTKMIDLRGSHVMEINEDAPHLLRNAELIDLRHNELHHLPSTFQVLNPAVVRLDLHTLNCSCDLDWLPAWLLHHHNHGLEEMTCVKNGKRILLINATEHDLCHTKPPSYQSSYKMLLIVLTVVLSTVTVVISVLTVFRYEVQVVTHSCRKQLAQRWKKQSGSLQVTHRFGVFISLNANSNGDTEWVKNVLVPSLDDYGLTSYLPPRDCAPGSVEMDELIKRMQDSASVLVVLSPDYVQNSSCLFQFSQAYSHMIARKHGSLFLVKRNSPLPRRSVREPHLRAMLTLRMFYSANHEHLDRALDALVPTETVM